MESLFSYYNPNFWSLQQAAFSDTAFLLVTHQWCSPNISAFPVSGHNIRLNYLITVKLGIHTLVNKIGEEVVCVISRKKL